MGKVAYLFGAGASCNCLPLIKDIPNAINKLREEIVYYHPEPEEKFKNIDTHTISQGKAFLLEQCEKLQEMVELHASIDTYAKKLFVTYKNKEYKALKVILSFLFMYLQSENPVDYRYDAFFASILGNSSDQFNGNIRIVSWNYDFQFEKAFSQFSQTPDLRQNQLRLGVYPDGLDIGDFTDRFCILKINGTTSFANKNSATRNMYPVDKFDSYNKTELIKSFIWFYLTSVERQDISISSMMSFAWESFPVSAPNSIISTASNAIGNSDAIVVIGYSFPFFNRVIDKILFASACASRDTKVYIQDTFPERIISKLSSVLPKDYPREKIVPIQAYITANENEVKDQFFLPPEL